MQVRVILHVLANVPPIAEKLVETVVAEASAKMADPSYAAALVDSWVRNQPAASHYVTAHVDELGGSEGVVQTVFHAALIDTCFRRAKGRSVPTLSFADLDHVAAFDRDAELRSRQPALADYLLVNVENLSMRGVLVLLALGMDHAV